MAPRGKTILSLIHAEYETHLVWPPNTSKLSFQKGKRWPSSTIKCVKMHISVTFRYIDSTSIHGIDSFSLSSAVVL